jgi:hypothetical protein
MVIDGVIVYNPLPARCFVDVDKECVIPIGGDIHPFDVESLTADLDDVKVAGTLPNGVAWGKTNPNTYGFSDILVDSTEVSEETIRQLIAANVITVN